MAQLRDTFITISEDSVLVENIIGPKKTILLVIGNYVCTGCVENLCLFLQDSIDTSEYTFLVLLSTEKSPGIRKGYEVKYRKMLPKATGHIYFDPSNNPVFRNEATKTGFMKKYHIVQTPEVFVFSNNSITQIKYNEIFSGTRLKPYFVSRFKWLIPLLFFVIFVHLAKYSNRSVRNNQLKAQLLCLQK